MYYVEEESRLTDLIEICGGFTPNADISDLNLAERLSDSDKIEVPKIVCEELEGEEEDSLETTSDLVNINKASKEELKSLDGIGDTLADNIINYRKNNRFETIEELLNVNGIGDAKFETIKEYICVD